MTLAGAYDYDMGNDEFTTRRNTMSEENQAKEVPKGIELSSQARGAFQALRDTLKQQHEKDPNDTGYMICMTLVVIVEEMLKSMETNTIVTYEQLQLVQKAIAAK